MGPVLELEGFGVSFAGRVVLAEVTLRVDPGVWCLVGPMGSGKSTLLRTVAGLNEAQPSLCTWGTARLQGQPLDDARPPGPGDLRPHVGFVAQQARLFFSTVRANLAGALPGRRLAPDALARMGLEALAPHLDREVASLPRGIQRLTTVARALIGDPVLLLADEPTASLDDADAAPIVEVLRAQGARRAVMVVTHQQAQARALGGTTALLGGGRLLAVAPTDVFFDAPPNAFAAQFVRTGGVVVARPDALPEEVDDAVPAPPPMPAAAAVRDTWRGPRGFFWALPGQLGGLPRPGIVASLTQDLERLRALGVTTLISLEEQRTVDPAALASFGITSVHAPIVDMGVPSVEEMAALCAHVEALLARGEVVAAHCRAGLGRTGTLLVCQLIHRGQSPREALERLRRLEPRAVQSEAQLAFLSTFAAHRNAVASGPPADQNEGSPHVA